MRLSSPVGLALARPAYATLLICAVAAAVTSCAPRYSLHEVTASAFELEEEAYVTSEAGLTFAYDFWGPEGVPFVALYNETADTLFVDLVASRVSAAAGEFVLGEVLAGGPANARDIAFAYPRLRLRRRPLLLVLPPAEWTEFYGVPQVSGTMYGGNGRREVSTYRYVVTEGPGAGRAVSHVFADAVTERLRRRDFDARSAAGPRPNLYYLDRGPRRERAATELAIGLTNVLWML